MEILRIDHVQLAMPRGEEDRARAFYFGLLGIPEVPKPAELAKRGGAWFERGDLKVHLGVEDEFRAARKAHPGLLVRGLRELAQQLRAAGVQVEERALDGVLHVYVADPFGNRIELLEREEPPAIER
jgi:catechol 2,3-dioxygenase-like lactoylglutathione lyase family enzyme